VPHRFWSRWSPWLSSKLNQAASGYLFKVFLGHEFCHLGCDWNQTPTGNGLGWPFYGCLSDIQYLDVLGMCCDWKSKIGDSLFRRYPMVAFVGDTPGH
jgi:hypothetical protein